MKYTVKVGTDAMIYILSFIRTDLGIQKLLVGDTQTHKKQRDFIRLLVFLNKKNR
jgi:hypothetical protein